MIQVTITTSMHLVIGDAPLNCIRFELEKKVVRKITKGYKLFIVYLPRGNKGNKKFS